MLQSLTIHNIAIIEQAQIDFNEGLNILTGETGAGKSIIIDAINMILGERTSKELVRSGQDSALVEALFYIEDGILDDFLQENGMPPMDEGALLIVREMNANGKSTSRVNGRMVTAQALKELAKNIVNIHGQHDSQALLSDEKHIGFLDSFGGKVILEAIAAYRQAHHAIKATQKTLKSMFGDDTEREKRIDLLQYQLEEIQNADLTIGEDEALIEKRMMLQNGEKLLQATSQAYELLFEGNEGMSAYSMITQAERLMHEVARYDKQLGTIAEGIAEAGYIIEEKLHTLRNYMESLEFNPDMLDEIEHRLDLIYKLKRKYGATVEDILTNADDIAQELDALVNSEQKIQALQQTLAKQQLDCTKKADALFQARLNAAKQLEKSVLNELRDLDMGSVQFAVAVEHSIEFKQDGADNVSFLISTNVGEPMKPMAKIASGGELSRIMLALKTILADHIGTLIFDEIDTGVSGRAAQRVGEKLSKLACKKQVLCITHLPQIAAMADTHYLIEKTVEQAHTKTKVHALDSERRIEEVARMIGGAQMTALTLSHAEELLALADERKKGRV
ncbi:MAG: DNA repair protein RecN [Hyphomonadaceae bacterium]|nr:DNA repair protein RecN [Clostridia bacterium]